MLGEALLAIGDPDAAADQGRRLVSLGEHVQCGLITARGQRLVGRALGDRQQVEAARTSFAVLGMPLDIARCALAIAEILVTIESEQETAVSEARSALAAFDALGASRDAATADAWLRALEAPASTRLSVLTRREIEVLEAVAEGLSNPEIADRLYISRRTVEHHVASVLAKLGLRNRAEAAVFAARNG